MLFSHTSVWRFSMFCCFVFAQFWIWHKITRYITWIPGKFYIYCTSCMRWHHWECHPLTDHLMTPTGWDTAELPLIHVVKPKAKSRLSSDLHANPSCCATCSCLIHVCELQGVVSGVFDSLLSHKECFQALPHFHWGKKKWRVSTHSFQHKLCVLCWEKVHPILAMADTLMWEEVCVGLSFEVPAKLSFCLTSGKCEEAEVTLFLTSANIEWYHGDWSLETCIRQLQGPVTFKVGENKTGGCQNLSQAVWNPAKPWNE